VFKKGETETRFLDPEGGFPKVGRGKKLQGGQRAGSKAQQWSHTSVRGKSCRESTRAETEQKGKSTQNVGVKKKKMGDRLPKQGEFPKGNEKQS